MSFKVEDQVQHHGLPSDIHMCTEVHSHTHVHEHMHTCMCIHTHTHTHTLKKKNEAIASLLDGPSLLYTAISYLLNTLNPDEDKHLRMGTFW